MDRLDHNPAILFLHDGELAELSAALEVLGVAILDRRDELTDHDRTHAWDLVLGSSKRMLALPGELEQTPNVRIAILDGDSKTVRSMLRRAGADLVVRRPVHPAALRLLILHTLYRGPEKRRATRVSIGASVRFRTGLRKRNAILADLSPSGCRLLAPIGSHPTTPGGNLTILLPAELCEGRALTLHGHAARVDRPQAGTIAIAVSFDKLKPNTMRRLDQVVAAHADGPAVLDSEAAAALQALPPSVTNEDAAALAEPQSAELEPDAAERRDDPRRQLSRRIIALGEQAARVLIGSDLSAGGMRVEHTPGLELGDRLKIALHVESGTAPLVLGAEVIRDDPEAGHALRFTDVDDTQRAKLQRIVDDLPLVSEPEPEPDEPSGIYVSEVLSRRAV
jgi:c-di-GMP-binding flagellar brake protein YcgR